ncbi:MAG: 50S ribosomal protein L30 [Synergistaceae bacterium]|nr:50S ribosomal protein L30 [Synergistaceae bacterium]
MARIRIKWVKSTIGYAKNQHKTIEALGFHKLNNVVEHEATPGIMGMINKVSHLVECSEVES